MGLLDTQCNGFDWFLVYTAHCTCDESYTGSDCAIYLPEPPVLVTIETTGACDTVDGNDDCTCLYFTTRRLADVYYCQIVSAEVCTRIYTRH